MTRSGTWRDESGGDGGREPPTTGVGSHLIVVSNRQPYRHEYADGTAEEDESGERSGGQQRITVDEPAGGLTAGLDSVMREVDGTWIAWGDGDADRAVVDGNDAVLVPPEPGDGQYTLARVWLDDAQVDNYYYGFANRVLWPLCHSALSAIDAEAGFWRDYRAVNEQFAAAVGERATDESVVWFQDYHLALAPSLLGRRAADPFVAHTWHVPWPSWDVFRSCPHGREILRGLLGADLLTFHVPRHCENFLECVERGLPEVGVDWGRWRVIAGTETTTLRAFPMGVPAADIARAAGSTTAESFWEEFGAEHGLCDRRMAVGVDRLDYTKGIPQRLRALEHLWASRPRWRGEVTYVQVGTESRSQIPAYSDYQSSVEADVQRINERFGTDEWTPVVYTTEMLADEALYALYRHADCALVTPIRDGMNLVAQEYVAANDGDGALVLSDQAGAHDELGEWALSVSPHDVRGVASAIEAALTMPPRERRSRMAALACHVAANDIDAWLGAVFEAIQSLRNAGTAGQHPARA